MKRAISYQLSSIICTVFLFFGLTLTAHAKEISIIYSGETHAMLYHCGCPIEPDGGIARRAAMVKMLRKAYPGALLFDCGAYFAGGLMDEYTQNTEMDMQRTQINLKAMELMKYDAVALGDEEFNFGSDFLESMIKNSSLKFVSSNVRMDKVYPYIIKETGGVKIGIIGLTTITSRQKAGAIRIDDPKPALLAAIEEIKKKGVNIIVLLSHLGDEDTVKLLNEVRGVDIVISGHIQNAKEPISKAGDVLILRPSWQGRRLSRLSFSLSKDGKIESPKLEEMRLSDQLKDDPEISAILPVCFSDNDCKKEGSIGLCQNPGTKQAKCAFSPADKVSLSVVAPRNCRTCNSEVTVNMLKRLMPGLSVSYLYYPEQGALDLIKKLGIKTLPAFVLGKEMEKDKAFEKLQAKLLPIQGGYVLNPELSGIALFVDRPEIKGKLDLFLSIYDKNAPQVLDTIKEFRPVVHLLAAEKDNVIQAAAGSLEVEEYLRAVCVQKYYPGFFWNYLSCRAKSTGTSWWEDCAENLDAGKIKSCARGAEGIALLRENIALAAELQVMFGPTYLLNNQEIFTSKDTPSKEELRKIIKAR